MRGVGATVALPFLDAMAPVSALARTAKPVHRFQAIFVPNGMAMEYWSPATVGRGFELTPILRPLAPFRDRMLVFSGLNASWTYVHAGASGSFLTGTSRGGTSETDVVADTSIDQMLAREFSASTPLASLELSIDKEANAGQCTSGLSCAYTQTISWRTPTTPLPMEKQSPGGLRAAVRRQRIDRPRGAARAHAGEAQHPRLGDGQAGRRRAPGRNRRPAQGEGVRPRRSATSSGASSWPNPGATRSRTS